MNFPSGGLGIVATLLTVAQILVILAALYIGRLS